MLPCEFLFIGEAPGDTEDVTGFPFAGKAGKVLDRMITDATAHAPCIWAIANVVLCKPQDGPGQKFREPTEEEKRNCRPRLDYFVGSIAKPKGIICLGEHAARSAPFRQTNEGAVMIPHISVRHPAYIMYNGGPDKSRGAEIFAAEVHKITDFIQETLRCIATI
jgi:DNA polymerase